MKSKNFRKQGHIFVVCELFSGIGRFLCKLEGVSKNFVKDVMTWEVATLNLLL